MRAIDFAPLSQSTIGFERLFDLLDTAAQSSPTENYPPYDIEKTGEDTYRIVLAVAGFSDENVSVTVEANLLTIEGQRPDGATGEYLYHGIGARAFRRQFNLADHIEVRGAKLENGLLTIELEHELPEEMKPRRVEIGTGSKPKMVPDKLVA